MPFIKSFDRKIAPEMRYNDTNQKVWKRQNLVNVLRFIGHLTLTSLLLVVIA